MTTTMRRAQRHALEPREKSKLKSTVMANAAVDGGPAQERGRDLVHLARRRHCRARRAPKATRRSTGTPKKATAEARAARYAQSRPAATNQPRT